MQNGMISVARLYRTSGLSATFRLAVIVASLFLSVATLRAQVPTTGLDLWLKAGDITGVTDGQPVSTWNDASGNSRNATSTGTFRPTLVTSAINSLPAVRFTGSGGTDKNGPLMNVNLATGAAVTAFVVAANQRPTLPGNTVDIVMASKLDFPTEGFGFASFNAFANGGSRQFVPEGGNPPAGNKRMRKNGIESTGLALSEFAIGTYIGTNLQNTGGSGATMVLNALADSIRAGQNDIAEVILYNRELTVAEISQVETYLSTKYAIALIIPLPPPFTNLPDGVKLWLRAEDVASVGNGNPIGLWADSSRNGKNAVSVGAARPTLVANAISSRPAVRFTGSQYMTVPLSTSSRVTAFVVARNRRAALGANTIDVLLASHPAAATSGFGFFSYNSADGSSSRRFSTAPGGDASAIPRTRKNSASSPVTLNQDEFAIGTYVGRNILNQAPTAIGDTLRINALRDLAQFGEHDIAEIIVYDTQLPTASIKRVELYLAQKYGITPAPSTAPTSITVDEFTNTNTAVNGWTAQATGRGYLDGNVDSLRTFPYGVEQNLTNGQYALSFLTDLGTPALKVSSTGINGFNADYGAYNYPGQAAYFEKRFKAANGTDSVLTDFSNAKVFHVFMRTTTQALNRYNFLIAPIVRLDIGDEDMPDIIAGRTENGVGTQTWVMDQSRVTHGGTRFSRSAEQYVTLIPDGEYREYIFDYTNNFRGVYHQPPYFGFVDEDPAKFTRLPERGLITVDSSRVSRLLFAINGATAYAQRVITLTGARGPFAAANDTIPVDGFNDFPPVIDGFVPRFNGDVFINRIVANNDRTPLSVKATTATPSVPANGKGYYAFGSSGLTIDIATNTSVASTLSGSVGAVTLTTADTIAVDTNLIKRNEVPLGRRAIGVGDINRIVPTKVWTLNRTAGTGNLDYTLYLDVSDFLPLLGKPSAGTIPGRRLEEGAATLVILYRPGTSGSWTPLPTYVSGSRTLVTYGVKTFGQFAVGTNADENPNLGTGFSSTGSNGAPVAARYKLEQNYPNPFNPTTSIRYSLAAAGDVSLKIYDILGREIATLVNERKTSGSYIANFNAAKLASGVYFYKLKAGDFVQTKKMMLIK